MADVYVLSGRNELGNSDWGYGCDDVSVFGVYNDFEKAKSAFKKKVLEVARNVADSEEDFEYTEDDLFETNDSNEESFGWSCCMGNNRWEWILFIPETDDFDYGFWFQPVVFLKKFEVK